MEINQIPVGFYRIAIEATKADFDKLNNDNLLAPYYIDGEGPSIQNAFESDDEYPNERPEKLYTVLELEHAPLELVVKHLIEIGLMCDITLIYGEHQNVRNEYPPEYIVIRENDGVFKAHVCCTANVEIAVEALASRIALNEQGIFDADKHFDAIVKEFHPHGWIIDYLNG